MLYDLTVQNYRCFENFQIDGLERVNLFVGNNNSGKTSLLEAIYLLSSNDTHFAFHNILEIKKEYIESNYVVDNIFLNYYTKETKAIVISSNRETKKQINIAWSEYPEHLLLTNYEEVLDEIPFFLERIKKNSSKFINTTLEKTIYIPTDKRNTNFLAYLWDKINLTYKEDKVIAALQIIEPKVEKIGFSVSNLYQMTRLKISGEKKPIPLNSMGEGMYRILALAMSLVTSENGVLLDLLHE